MGDNDADKAKKPKKPKLPKDAPQDLKDFLACKKNKVEIAGGKLDWLGMIVSPTVTFKAGANAGEVEVTMESAVTKKVTTTGKVVDGKLEVDTTKLPLGKETADTWIKDLNDWLESRKKKLGPAEVKDGKLVLTKVAIAPAGAAAPGVKEKVSFDPFPNVPRWEKAAAGGAFLLATAVGIAAMPSDETKTVQRQVEVPAAPGGQDATTSSSSSTTSTTRLSPTQSEITIQDACFDLMHGDGSSNITSIFTVDEQWDGNWIAEFAAGPTGPVRGTGQVTNGLGEIPIQIFQFGTYDGLVLTAPDGTQVPIGPFQPLMPFVVGPDEQSCDASSLTPAPAQSDTPPPADADNDPSTGDTGDAAAGADETNTVTVTGTQTTEGKPWSLLLIPGTAVGLWGGLWLDERRRGSIAYNRDLFEEAGLEPPNPALQSGYNPQTAAQMLDDAGWTAGDGDDPPLPDDKPVM